MSEQLRVAVVKYNDRKNLLLQFRDPLTEKLVTKSARTANRKEAERLAGRWESELRAGRYARRGEISWAAFRERYEAEKVPSFKPATRTKVQVVFDLIEEILNPVRLRELTPARLSKFQSELRSRPIKPKAKPVEADGTEKKPAPEPRWRSEATIGSYLAHLKAALVWAQRMEMILAAPTIEKPKQAKSQQVMKGRPITLEEFERIVAAVPKVVGEPAAPSWVYFITGLWWSGLRLSEALELWWDRDDRLRVDLEGKRPMLRIPASLDKGGKDRILPMAPEFAQFLLQTPIEERQGRVFKLQLRRQHGARVRTDNASRLIALMGKVAGVKVRADERTGDARKFASAHDFRRSFGERWSTRVLPQVLQELMRHENINTTLRFYVGRNAERTADAVWQAFEEGQAAKEAATKQATRLEESAEA